MKIILLVQLLWLFGQMVHAQNYGVTKVYSDVFANQGQDIEYDEINDQTYIITSKICDSVECSELVLFSASDSILFQRTVPNLDVASYTSELVGDYLYTFGNTVPGSQTWSVNQNDLRTGELVRTVVLSNELGLDRVWIQSSRVISDNFMLIGNTKQNNETIGMLYIVDEFLVLDTLIYIDTVLQGRFTDIYTVTDTTFAVLYDEQGTGSINDRRRWLAVYDSRSYQRLWAYRSEYDSDNAFSRGLYLGEGDFLFDVGVELRGSKFVRVNRDTVIKWERDFSRDEGSTRTSLLTRDLLRTQDGHIVIAGACTDTYDLAYRPNDSPCITKINSHTGEVIWQRIIYQDDHLDPGNGLGGVITSIVEKPNGDLIMTGDLFERERIPMLYVRTDSEGCITPDCGKYIDLDELVVSSEEVELDQQDAINVFPNPATDQITLSSQATIHQVTLHHIDGRIAYQEIGLADQEHVIDVSNLSTGLYIVSVTDQLGRVSTSKVLVR